MKSKKFARMRRKGVPFPRYTADDRIKTVTGYRQSGMTMTEFAETWGISDNTLRKWNRAFEEGGQDALAGISSASGRPKGSKKPVPPAVRKAEVLALAERPRQPFYMAAQIGETALAVSAERGTDFYQAVLIGTGATAKETAGLAEVIVEKTDAVAL